MDGCHFFLYGFVLLNQLLLNLQVIREICYESGYNLSVGVYSYVVAVILAIIFYLVDVDMGEYLICGFLVAQGVQIVMNYFIIRTFGEPLLSLFYFFWDRFRSLLLPFFLLA